MKPLALQAVAVESPRKCGVLVADDEPAIREMLDFALDREGFSVCLAEDGQQAVHQFVRRQATIDVLLLDVLMPSLDGPQTLGAIQRLAPEIPCCFMSAYFGRYSAVDLQRRGGGAVLRKPFDLLEVIRVLRRLANDERGIAHNGNEIQRSAGQRTLNSDGCGRFPAFAKEMQE